MKELTKSQYKFFEIFDGSKDNIFLLGAPGTGKSYCISLLRKSKAYEQGEISLTSSTGTSALNIQGSTIHSWCGIGLADGNIQQIIKKVSQNKEARKRIQNCKTLVLEEASMISGELFDKVMSVISHLRFTLPRIILVGDLAQLPPVFKSDNKYIFESEWFKKLKFLKINLTEVVRQSQKEFVSILSEIRDGNVSNLDILKKRISNKPPENSLIVYCKNIDVNAYNKNKLESLPTKSKIFRSNDIGNQFQLESLERSCPAPGKLELKLNAKVMLLKNINTEGGLVNGSIGIVKDITGKYPKVAFGKKIIEIEPEKWEIIEEKVNDSGKTTRKVVAFREQIPLKLAWATTVHKTQGMTCDEIFIDLSGCWAPGQAYTALSRARTLEGLTLSSIDESMIKVDNRVINFYKEIEYV